MQHCIPVPTESWHRNSQRESEAIVPGPLHTAKQGFILKANTSAPEPPRLLTCQVLNHLIQLLRVVT